MLHQVNGGQRVGGGHVWPCLQHGSHSSLGLREVVSPAGSLKWRARVVPVRARVPQTASTILRYAFSGNALTVVVRTLPIAPTLRAKVTAVASSVNWEMATRS